MIQNKNVVVAFMVCGEATTDVAFNRLKDIFCEKNIYTLAYFSQPKAIAHAFRIGLESNKDYLLITGADIVLEPSRFFEFYKQVIHTRSDIFFRHRAQVVDKLLMSYSLRKCPSLYVIKHLPLIKSFDNLNSMIPEGFICKEFTALGLKTKSHKIIVGTHDFNQRDFDIYRKGYLWSHKLSPEQKEIFIPRWKILANTERDFKIVLLGYTDGLKDTRTISCDISLYDPNFIKRRISEAIDEQKDFNR